MSIDRRTRFYKDIRQIERDEAFDELLPFCLDQHAELAGRGLLHKGLPALALRDGDRAVTLFESCGQMTMSEGVLGGATVAALAPGALSALVQDQRTTMGLAMMSMVKMERGDFADFVGWESVFRALIDGRAVYEAGSLTLRDRGGGPLDLERRFSLEDDREEIAHFLQEAGFLHIAGVFTAAEMAAVAQDIDVALAQAQPDDGLSWWAGTSEGMQVPVRVLSFQERSQVLRDILDDARLTWIGDLPGDGHLPPAGAEGLIKPLDIQTGLSDLPWHKDCGQGSHSYMCNSMTVGISVTGADEESGALGVLPGSHRASLQAAGLDPTFDLPSRKLCTQTGDITVHCSDTFHRAYRPLKRSRKVVYTGFRQPDLPGDILPKMASGDIKAARAKLTNVRDRIAASEA